MSRLLLLTMLVGIVTLCNGELYRFTASLGGAQVLPTPVTTNARGSATLVYDDSSRKLTYDIGFQDLTGVTAIHIHGPAPPTGTADVITDLRIPDGSGRSTGSVILEQAHFEALVAGRLYLQVHTTANPGGEIRGQVISTATEFFAHLVTSHIIPSGSATGDASGYGLFKLNSNRELSWDIEHDVQRSTMAHIHGPADKSTNAAVLFEFNGANSPIRGSRTLTEQQVTFLKTGLLYVVVHSERFPNGEIRGQILIDPSSSGYDGFGTVVIAGLVLSSVALVALVLLGAFAYWHHRRTSYVLVDAQQVRMMMQQCAHVVVL